MIPKRIISGGQTGVDRGALDAALELGIPCGGVAPKGRLAEDGPIPERYPLEESPSSDYAVRTEANVLAADATLILVEKEPLTGGTRLTLALARRHAKPVEVVSLNGPDPACAIRLFLNRARAGILNVAGPRESSFPGIAEKARRLLVVSLSAPPTTGAIAE